MSRTCVPARVEAGGGALADQAQRGCGDQAGTNQAVGSGLVTAAAAVQEQVGLGAEQQLGAACAGCAQGRPVASRLGPAKK